MVIKVKVNEIPYFIDEEEWKQYKNWYDNLIYYGKKSLS